MKCVVLILLVASVLVAIAMSGAAAASKRQFDVENEAEALFEQFIKDHNRQYVDQRDRDVHFQAFKTNLHKINESNAKNPSATYGINKFADYTEEESKQMFGSRKQ